MQSKKRNAGGSDPKGFDSIVSEVFAPIYPVISEQIIEQTGKLNGYCLDLGCGTGALGRSIAKLSDLHVTFYDQSKEMLDISTNYVKEENLIDRSSFRMGDVHEIPLDPNCMDLVISRGSIPFWDDLDKAFSEIMRVLKNDGHAYIGGGFGNEKLRNEIIEKMNKRKGGWRNSTKDKFDLKKKTLPKVIQNLNIGNKNFIKILNKLQWKFHQ